MSIDGLSFILLIFVLVFVPSLFVYLNRRLDHRQVMAAIDKGIPLSELSRARTRNPSWTRNLSLGVAFLVGSLTCVFFLIATTLRSEGKYFSASALVGAGVFLSIGIFFIVFALLQRRVAKHKNNDDTSASAVE